MKVKQEYREERNDVYSFWNNKKVININDEVEVIEEKIDECTLIELEKRIEDHNTEIVALQDKIAVEQLKINLINELI